MDRTIRFVLGYQHWSPPWRVREDRLEDEDGDTFVSFFHERPAGWRNSLWPAPVSAHVASAPWRHYAALVAAMGDIWQVALDVINGHMGTDRAPQHMRQFLQPVCERFGAGAGIERIVPQAPWIARDAAVYNCAGQPVAVVHALASRVTDPVDAAELQEARARFAYCIATMPDVVCLALQVGHAKPGAPGENLAIARLCEQLLEKLAACASLCDSQDDAVALPLAA